MTTRFSKEIRPSVGTQVRVDDDAYWIELGSNKMQSNMAGRTGRVCWNATNNTYVIDQDPKSPLFGQQSAVAPECLTLVEQTKTNPEPATPRVSGYTLPNVKANFVWTYVNGLAPKERWEFIVSFYVKGQRQESRFEVIIDNDDVIPTLQELSKFASGLHRAVERLNIIL